MRATGAILLFCLAFHTTMACSSWWTTPVHGPPTPENPCGAGEHECSDHGCCYDGWACTVDRDPIYADPPGHGYCTDQIGRKAPAKASRSAPKP